MLQENKLLYADLYVAAKYCRVMPDLVARHAGGGDGGRSLDQLKELAARLASSVDDAECREGVAAIGHLAADLSSAPEHQGDFLRRRILREIESLERRLTAIAAARAAQPAGGRAQTSS
jgi:hypothetical protein